MTSPTIDVTILAYCEHEIEHNIRAWLPHVRKLVVVVGGERNVEQMGLPPTDPDTIASVKRVNDPEGKIVLVTQAGFWKDKNEMAMAAGDHVKADLVWQVDADEFYLSEDIERARRELSDDNWVFAGMPHVIFWKTLDRVLVGANDNVGWCRVSRIWRRLDGFKWMHIPFSSLRDKDGQVTQHEQRPLHWGRVFHSSWCGPAKRLEFKFAYHRARGDGPPQAWFDSVWAKDHVPANGVHPGQPGIFPRPYKGPLPPAIVAAVRGDA